MCPVCRRPMVVYEFEGVEVDHCLECDGVWLDAGELQLLTDLGGVRAGGLSAALGRAEALARSRRRCPRCRRRLRSVAVTGGHAPGGSGPGSAGHREEKVVAIDRCPRGHGLWFDKGEMETLVRSFSEGQEGAVARFFGELYRGSLWTPSGGR